MSTHVLTSNHKGWILTAIIFALLAHVSISHSANRLLAWPVDRGVTRSQSSEPLKTYEVRKGQIALSPEILPKPDGADRQSGIAATKGEIVSIDFFSDVTCEVLIDSVKHHGDGTKIINGTLKNHKIGTFVMTIGPDGFFITAQDMNRSLLYRATGDTRQGTGTVTEIDMKKIPPMIR